MRFVADENVSRAVVEALMDAGHDVWRPPASAEDDVVLGMAYDLKAILVTEDRDFGEMVVRQKREVGGVLLLELERLGKIARASRIAAFLVGHSTQLAGALTIVEPGRARVRKLPEP